MNFKLRVTSTNFPLNTLDNPWEVAGLTPCTATGYTPNRPSVPATFTYDIGDTGSTDFPFTFDIVPNSCTPNYFKV